MNNKRLVLLGKTLFLLSFIFIFGGIYLQSKQDRIFTDPIKDIILIAGEDDNIIITPTDKDKDKENIESPVTPPTDDNNNQNLTDDKTPDQVPIETPPQISSPVEEHPPITTPPKEVEQLPQEPTTPIADENNILREKIEDTYGIKVKYGPEVADYKAGELGVVPILDNASIKNNLKELEYALSLYPTDFFKEFIKTKLNLEVYLVENFSTENITGITDLTGNRVIISIAVLYPFAESFHHEIYHYIEHFITRKNGKFVEWNMNNPTDFSYGKEADPNLSYNKTKNASSPFVNNYAQTSAAEDRASTFEYMTAILKSSCYSQVSYPIFKKSAYIALMIDTYFETVRPEIIDYWERFIS